MQQASSTELSGRNFYIVFLGLIVFAAFLYLRQLGDNSLGFPDADRILMDGVFMRDVYVDLPVFDPWGYAQAYFVQYPGLSIGYRPPLFPMVEGLFNLIFGINTWSSRLALFMFLVVGLYAWLRLATAQVGRNAAVLSSLLWLSMPFLVQWGWYTMAEIPVLSLSLVAFYMFYRWVERSSAQYIYLFALWWAAAIWTKQTAVFIGLAIPLYLWSEGRLLWALKQKQAWLASILFLVAVAPIAAMTLYFGEMNMYQSIGVGASEIDTRWTLENWFVHLNSLVVHIGLIVLIAALWAAGVAAFNKDKDILFAGIAILSVYVFFSLMVGKNMRYPMFWVPFWCLLVAVPLKYWPLTSNRGRAWLGVCLALVAGNVYRSYSTEPFYVDGYDDAAQIAVAETTGPSIFVDAYNNGYFTYFARQADTDKAYHILRGDKLLSSSSISTGHWQEIHMTSEEDILKAFQDYGVSIIVVEEINYAALDIHQKLRDMLQAGDDFELLKRIRISSNKKMSSVEGQPDFDGQYLAVYRYLKATNKMSGDILLRLPVVGQNVGKTFDQ